MAVLRDGEGHRCWGDGGVDNEICYGDCGTNEVCSREEPIVEFHEVVIKERVEFCLRKGEPLCNLHMVMLDTNDQKEFIRATRMLEIVQLCGFTYAYAPTLAWSSGVSPRRLRDDGQLPAMKRTAALEPSID